MTYKEHFQKVAEKTYPMSRAYNTAMNVGSFGIHKALNNRALQGQVNEGTKPWTKDQGDVMSKMKKEDNGKKYPISRFLQHPATWAASGLVGGVTDAIVKNKTVGQGIGQGLLGAGIGAAANYGGAYLNKYTHARALKGRAEKGRTGWGERERDTLKQLKK